MPNLVVAYSDESGNTGLNLFDDRQPWFWTGTLLTRVALQGPGLPVLTAWTSRLGVPELHANDLGLARIEGFAGELKAFLAKHECRFVFTRLEKRHHAALTLVDAVLDSGLNPAVSHLHYGARALRLPLAHMIVENLTGPDQEAFWTAYGRGDGDGFRQVLWRLASRIQSRVRDARTRQLLSDALAWAAAHPSVFLEPRRSGFDSPNFVAFTLLLDGIHDLYKGTRVRVGTFVHDEQKEFGRFLKQAFDLGANIVGSGHPLEFISDLRRVQRFRCSIQLVPSRGVVGLQLVDVVLWLVKRHDEVGLDGYPACAAVVESIAKRSIIKTFSRDQLREDVLTCLDALNRIRMSAEDTARSRRISSKVEEARQRRMRGLEP